MGRSGSKGRHVVEDVMVKPKIRYAITNVPWAFLEPSWCFVLGRKVFFGYTTLGEAVNAALGLITSSRGRQNG